MSSKKPAVAWAVVVVAALALLSDSLSLLASIVSFGQRPVQQIVGTILLCAPFAALSVIVLRARLAVVITHTGGCHCGRVRFEVVAPARIEVMDCDCSICLKAGYLHLIVPKSRFKLLSGAEALTTYEFNTKTAKHLFCSVCGIKAFYVPRSHPDGYSVNARCLDAGTVEHMTVTPSDGKNWEKTHVPGRDKRLD